MGKRKAEDLLESVLSGGKNVKSQKVDSEDFLRPSSVEITSDLGNLTAVDFNTNLLIKDDEESLSKLARDNVQLVFNELMLLPTSRVDEVIVAQLPPPTSVIPREKPLPKEKPLTKWEQFAKEKGIKKTSDKKKGRLVWDDQVREWVPRYGYKKAQAEIQKTWCLEMKGNAPDDEDPFAKMAEEKRERMAKNETQRLRNIARAQKVKIPNAAGGPTLKTKNSSELSRAADLAKKSTASLGKFQAKLSDSKLEKKAASEKPKGNKRKFKPAIGDGQKEKEANLKILENLNKGRDNLDMTKAVGKQIQTEDRERHREKSGRSGGRGGKNKGGKKGGKGNFTKKAARKAGGKGTKRR